MNKVLIIIPAYNEAGSIQKVVENLRQKYNQYDYIIVNDGSRDDTGRICRRNGYNLLDLPINLGLAGAIGTGMKYANLYEYDYVVQLDGDGQHDPKYIANMLECMQLKQADVVIGSRFKEKGKEKSLRMLGSEIIRWLIRLTVHQNITDPTSGMRMYSKRIIARYAKEMNFNPEPDTISYLIRCGAKVEEIQVEMREREEGESYLNLKASLKYMIKMCFSIAVIQVFRKRKVLS